MIGELEAIKQQRDLICLGSYMFLELVLSIHDLEAAAIKRCKHLGCRLAAMQSWQCFGGNVQRSTSCVVWATPAHQEKPWAVGHEIRPGCLKIVAYTESKPFADALAKTLGDWSIRDGDRESDMKR